MNIVIIGISILFIATVIAYINLSRKMKIVSAGFTELLVSITKLNEFTQPENIIADDVHKESFIKFLSDSRDWAFEYIENVQNGLTEFTNALDKDIEYFDTFGDSMSIKPNYELLQKISIEYKKLKSLLPEDKKETDSE